MDSISSQPDYRETTSMACSTAVTSIKSLDEGESLIDGIDWVFDDSFDPESLGTQNPGNEVLGSSHIPEDLEQETTAEGDAGDGNLPSFVSTFDDFDARHSVATRGGRKRDQSPNVELEQTPEFAVLRHSLEGETEAKPTETFVQRLLTEGEISVMYGPPGAGKTFIGLDLACSLAAGTATWMGLGIEQGGVLYAALEGLPLVKLRIKGWKDYHRIDTPLPIDLIEQGFSLDKLETIGMLIATIKQANATMMSKFGVPLRLFVIDTFSRVLGEYDENSSSNVSAIVKMLDQVKEQTGCHIMVVHHCGKDVSRGARGSSALLGAVDTEICVEPGTNPMTGLFRVTKQRGIPHKVEFAFRLKIHEMGRDKWQDAITTAICELAQDIDVKKLRESKLPPQTQMTLDKLTAVLVEQGQEFRISMANPPDNIPAGHRYIKVEDWKSACVNGGIYGSDDEAMRIKRKRPTRTIYPDRDFWAKLGAWQSIEAPVSGCPSSKRIVAVV